MAQTASAPNIPKEQPGDDPDDVLFNNVYGVRTIELNRPKKLNSLNASMARKIIPRLKVRLLSYLLPLMLNPLIVPPQEWANSDLAQMILISGTGPRAFCAGGDVAALAQQNTSGPSGVAASKAYFQLEYQLDHLIATYPKPYIAYMDGITMGGGVGLSVHAPFRIATERTVFGMPETSIGFFPDVGGSFFLPRLGGQLGRYLALTSAQLRGVQAYWTGVATHYIHSSALSPLTARLAELVFKDYEPLEKRHQSIDATIEEFSSGLPHDQPIHYGGALREAIDRCFSPNTIEGILTALETESSPSNPNESLRDWAFTTLETLHEKSPTSLKVSLRQLIIGANLSITDTFQREAHIAATFMTHPDFVNGVSAKLIHKPASKPVWDPPRIEDVTNEEVDRFVDMSGRERMPMLAEGDYVKYPYRNLGLPQDAEVQEAVVKGEGRNAKELVKAYVRKRRGKAGVKEKVEEVLARKCSIGNNGRVLWEDEG